MVPELTKEAEAKRAELIHQIDDRWLERTQTINDLQQQLADVETKKPDLATSEEHKRNLADAAEYRKRAEEFRTAANMPNPTMHVPPNWQGDGYEVGVDRKWALEQAEYLEQQASVAENKVQGEWEIWRDHVRHDLEAQHAGQLDDLRNDVKAVTDFDTNQANWNLTSDQAAMLTCEKPPEEPGGTSTFDNADGIYDVVGGRPD